METGSYEDNDRLRKEIAKLIKRDLDFKIEVATLKARIAELEGTEWTPSGTTKSGQSSTEADPSSKPKSSQTGYLRIVK